MLPARGQVWSITDRSRWRFHAQDASHGGHWSAVSGPSSGISHPHEAYPWLPIGIRQPESKKGECSLAGIQIALEVPGTAASEAANMTRILSWTLLQLSRMMFEVAWARQANSVARPSSLRFIVFSFSGTVFRAHRPRSRILDSRRVECVVASQNLAEGDFLEAP